MTTAVFDCVVLLQAAANPQGAAGACLAFVETGHVKLFVSPPIIDEARDVFTRPETRKRFPQLTEDKVDRYLLKVVSLATFLQDVPAAMQLPRDPTDEPYLNLAVAAQASFIVTRDGDMLSLMKDAAFRSGHPTLTIIEPPAFLTHVRTDVAKELGREGV